MSRTEQAYIDFDPYADECDVSFRRVAIVKVRKARTCLGVPADDRFPEHEVPVGTPMRSEFCVVEGEPSQYYTCLDCIDCYLASENL